VSDVAGELYGLDLASFTAERNRVAATLSGAEKAMVLALPKPSAAAWLVNQIVRAEPDAVADAIALGPDLRAAQSSFDRDALRELGAQRRDALRELALAARRVSAARGRPLSSAIADDVEQTFVAAIADEAAGEAVRSGRLVRALQSVGGEPVDLDGAVGAPGSVVGPGKRRPAAPAPDRGEKARADLEAARAQEEVARSELDAADEELDAAAARHGELLTARDAALAEAERLEGELADAERRRREAIRLRDRANRQFEGAQRVVQRAEAKLEGLN
jgi:hypothetical protein